MFVTVSRTGIRLDRHSCLNLYPYQCVSQWTTASRGLFCQPSATFHRQGRSITDESLIHVRVTTLGQVRSSPLIADKSAVAVIGYDKAQEVCESRGGCPGLLVSNNPDSFCGRKATLKNRAQEVCESRGGRPGLPVPNDPDGL